MTDYTFEPEDVVVTSWGSEPEGILRIGTKQGIQAVHLPTGTIVQVENERGQNRNRAKAFEKLDEILRSSL